MYVDFSIKVFGDAVQRADVAAKMRALTTEAVDSDGEFIVDLRSAFPEMKELLEPGDRGAFLASDGFVRELPDELVIVGEIRWCSPDPVMRLLKRCWPELTIECSVCIEHESFEYLRVEDDRVVCVELLGMNLRYERIENHSIRPGERKHFLFVLLRCCGGIRDCKPTGFDVYVEGAAEQRAALKATLLWLTTVDLAARVRPERVSASRLDAIQAAWVIGNTNPQHVYDDTPSPPYGGPLTVEDDGSHFYGETSLPTPEEFFRVLSKSFPRLEFDVRTDALQAAIGVRELVRRRYLKRGSTELESLLIEVDFDRSMAHWIEPGLISLWPKYPVDPPRAPRPRPPTTA